MPNLSPWGDYGPLNDGTIVLSGIFSIPSYAYFYDRSIDQIDWGRLQIKLEDGVSKEKQEEIVKDLTDITGTWPVGVEETYKQIKSLEKI